MMLRRLPGPIEPLLIGTSATPRSPSRMASAFASHVGERQAQVRVGHRILRHVSKAGLEDEPG